MTAYIANHEKKRRIFTKRERELLHAIKHGYSALKLAAAAERLRSAKLGVFKCEFTMNSSRQPHEFSAEQVAQNDARVKRWLTMTADEIIEVHRHNSNIDGN